MYPTTVAEALQATGVEAATFTDLRLAGTSDPEVFGAAVAGGHSVLTENVRDFARIAAEHITAGGHHNGVLIALSSRFSRRWRAVLEHLFERGAAAGELALEREA
jgi:predicted nuclease of predicted toxin-antitoxin system